MHTRLKEPPRLEGYYYSGKEARQARDNNQLLSLRIETSLVCNLRCRYCCEDSGQPLTDEITYEQIVNVIDQGKELGVKSIVIIGGGEPTLYPKFKELVKYIYSSDLMPVIFTNNQTMTTGLARFLHDHNVSVIIKLDSLSENIQDDMAGVKGAYENIRQGLRKLLKAGYAKSADQAKLKLGASFVVNKQNVHDIPNIWRFCREKNIFPNLEMMTPQKRARNIPDLQLSQNEWRKLKLYLLHIDQNEYGYDWLPHTPLIACGCFQVMYNLHINVRGWTRPCAGITVEIANIKKYSLQEIMNLSFFKRAREIDKYLEGKCKNCEDSTDCIGCRGLAFSGAVNQGISPIQALCVEDPSCFKFKQQNSCR